MTTIARTPPASSDATPGPLARTSARLARRRAGRRAMRAAAVRHPQAPQDGWHHVRAATLGGLTRHVR